MIHEQTELTPREYILMEGQKEESRLAREHAVTMKRLELELAKEKYEAEVELKRLEAMWSSWLKLPSTVIKLPLYLLLGVGYIVLAIRKTEPAKSFWTLIS